jgi:dTDP-4-dehydrorhamnose 3,5-epimerase
LTIDVQPDATLPEVLLIQPVRHKDARGWFSETYNESAFQAAGVPVRFMQDNLSYSIEPGTLRGLHFQIAPYAQDKLVRCARGSILDIVVDLRKSSPRFGQHTRIELSRENGLLVFVPKGFAHGFCTLEKACEVSYKVSAPFSAAHDRGIAYNDPALGIDWPVPPNGLTLSDRDQAHPVLAKADALFD